MLGIKTNPDCAPVLLKSSSELPKYLVGGTLYRTGPGGVGEPGDKMRIKHFFDGFTQNHRFHIKDTNTVEYSCRSSCDALKQMYREANPDMSRVTSFGPRDPCQTYFQKFMSVVKMPLPESNVKTDDDMPADIVNVGVTIKRDTTGLVARTDSNVFQILDPVTLEPLTKYNYSKFSGQRLDGQMTASHVEFSIDGKTEYNYNLKLGKVPEYVVFSKTDDHITELARFEAPGTYLHSFWTTDNYVVLALWQAEFWGGGIGVPLNKNVLRGITQEWDSERETVFYVIAKDPTKSRDFKTFKGPAFFAFHTINAFEEEDGALVLDVCTYDNNRVLFDFMLEKFETDMIGVQKNKAFVTRFKLHDGKAETVFCYDTPLANLELPTINPRFQNKEHRYVYGVNMQDKGLFLFEAIVRVDSKTGETLYFMEEDETPGEALFVPDPESDEGDELAGVLLSVSLNLKTGKSSLLVLDPATMTVKTRVQMETKVNYGFHGSWDM